MAKATGATKARQEGIPQKQCKCGYWSHAKKAKCDHCGKDFPKKEKPAATQSAGTPEAEAAPESKEEWLKDLEGKVTADTLASAYRAVETLRQAARAVGGVEAAKKLLDELDKEIGGN